MEAECGGHKLITTTPTPALSPTPTSTGNGLIPGDIVVLEQGDLDSGVPAALIQIDPTSGAQTTLSSGGLLEGGYVTGFVLDPDTGYFFLAGSGGVIEINPENGTQSLLTQSGGSGIAIESPGHLLLAGGGRLRRFDVRSRTTSDLAAGDLLDAVELWAVQVATDGTIFVSGLAEVEPPIWGRQAASLESIRFLVSSRLLWKSTMDTFTILH